MPSRNIETSFSRLPRADIRRSKFKVGYRSGFTGNAGDLIPFYVQEILPGDTFNLKLNKLVRMLTPINPTMDCLYLDTYFFFVPNRLIWSDWQKFMGENDEAWAQDTSQFVPPHVNLNVNDDDGYDFADDLVQPGSILNYLGWPMLDSQMMLANGDNDGSSVYAVTKDFDFISLLDFNAYIKIWNDWFRDQNLMDECPLFTGSNFSAGRTRYRNFLKQLTGSNNNINPEDKGSCLKVSKFHDYFTSCLPAPQKGPDVLIPAGGSVIFNPYDSDESSRVPSFVDMVNGNYLGGTNNTLNAYGSAPGGIFANDDTSKYLAYDPASTLSLKGLEITVNNLRLAMQTQKLLERDARGGTRYIEIIRSHFGVDSPDARLQRSEYLGGKRIPLNMAEVIQTAQDSNKPLGTLAGRSVTSDIEDGFTKSFVEHGYIIGVCVVRSDRTYTQGFERRYFRKDRLDYYWPVLANIGEQPVFNREIQATRYDLVIDGDGNYINKYKPDDVFGYQEAWADYRYKPSRLAGYLDPNSQYSLSSWTYADYYNSPVYLSKSWLIQGTTEIDRTLAVSSDTSHQLLFDFYVNGSMVRPMPVHSIPGLVDHN